MSKNPNAKKNGGEGTAVGKALRFLAAQGKKVCARTARHGGIINWS